MEETKTLNDIRRLYPDKVREAFALFGDDILVTDRESFFSLVRSLKEKPLHYIMLLDLTCVDYLAERSCLEMVYTLFSLDRNHRLRVKVPLPAGELSVPSLTPLWKNADWLEREVFDMFGVCFEGHPDLRRLFLYEGFQGHPLRKDYPLRKRQPIIPRENRMATRLQKEARSESMLLNMGPSHPAMHGAVRLMLELEGERVLNSEIELGYLHRGFEKTCEQRTYFNLLPYTDRLNYVSPLINNLGYVMTVEKMLGLKIPERAQYIRVLMSELSRVSDHLTCLAAMAMECGAFTVFLYNIKAREFIWDVIEYATGARMTTSYIRIGGVRADLQPGFQDSLRKAVTETRKVLKDVHGLLDKNKIFLNRTREVGTISQEEALSYGWTGPCLRSTGVYYDVRKAHPYLVYDRLEFEVPLGERGDNYDRYQVRMSEMEQSLRIIEQAVRVLPGAPPPVQGAEMEPEEAIRESRIQKPSDRPRLSPTLEGSEKNAYPGILADDGRSIVPAKEDTYTSIEGLIRHFKFFMAGHGIRPPKGEAYFSVEGGNGELGTYIVSDGSDRPYRLHLRAPCLHLLAALESLIRGRFVADIIPTFGSMNIILGELDR